MCLKVGQVTLQPKWLNDEKRDKKRLEDPYFMSLKSARGLRFRDDTSS